MTAPWGVKFYKPDVSGAQNLWLKIVFSQDDNIFIWARSLAWTLTSLLFLFRATLALAGRFFWSRASIYFFGNLLKRPLANWICISSTFISDWWILIISEEFERREAFDVVRATNTLISSHINCSYLNNTFKLLCSQLPRWSKGFAMATPGSIEFYEPKSIFVIQDQVFEVSLSKFYHRTIVTVKTTCQVEKHKTRGNNKLSHLLKLILVRINLADLLH